MKTKQKILNEIMGLNSLELEIPPVISLIHCLRAMDAYADQFKPNSINTVLCGEGQNEAVIVHGDNTITNKQNEANTLTAPNVLLPAEGLAKSVCGGVVFMCENCMSPLPFLRKGNLCHNCA